MNRTIAACAALIAAASCSGTGSGGKAESARPEVPDRAPTGGDALFALVPGGVEILFELDLARLRANQAVGPLVRRVENDNARRASAPGLAFAPFALLGLAPEVVPKTDVVLMASYGVGTADAASLVLVRGEGLRELELPGGQRVDARTFALGPAPLLERLREVASGSAPSVAGDLRLLAIRAAAMPAKAKGASARLAAHLGFDARVALAARLELDVVPASISIWGDVADDLAVVALLGGDKQATPAALVRAAERWRSSMSRQTMVRRLLLGGFEELVEIREAKHEARVLFIVGPRRLERLVRRIEARLGSGGQGEL